MFFVNTRHELEAKAAYKVAAAAGGSRLQNSAFANTFLAPVLANRYPFIITPYLGLRAKLSQIWINRWTVLLFLVLVRTLLAITSLNEDIATARREALSACSGVEDMGSALASMPHYMSQGVNALTADGVERAINGLMSMLTLTVTGVEEIVLFVINMMTSTYVCLITLVIRGSLHAAIDLIESTSHFLNSTLGDIGHDIHTTVEDFQSAYNHFINGLDDVGQFFGAGGSIPKLNISSDITKLNHLQLPSGLDADLQTLNKNIPTFAQVHNFTNQAIEWPFEEIKKLIKESLPKYHFDRNVFPVPPKKSLTFCSDNNGIGDFFDKLVDLSILARKIAIAVLVILAVLVCAPMAWLEIRRNRKLIARAALVRDASTAPMDAVYIASRPLTADAGMKAATAFKATRRQALVRWAVAYATTVPALFVLSLGVAGLLSCLSRYLIIRAVQHEVPDLTNEVADFAGKVVMDLEEASKAWANGTNGMILDISGRINDDVFGWVNTSTHALNHTLNVFVHESIDALKDVFGGTVLYGPVKELFNCLIGLKIAGIEHALTWVHQHAHIDFPLLPDNTFSLGAASSLSGDSGASFLTKDPSGGATDAITSIVNALAAKIISSIRTEAIISSCVLAVWVIIALIGISRAAYLFYGTGHMPSDMPGGQHPDDVAPVPTNSGSPPDGEKSPSFVGDIIHPPSQTQYQPRDFQQTNASRLDKGSQPPGYNNHNSNGNSSLGGTNLHPNSANNYNGSSYTLTPRPFPQLDKPTHPLGNPSPSPKTKGNAILKPKNMSGLWAQPLSPVPENMGYAGKRDVRGATKPADEVRRSQYAALGAAAGGGSNANGGVTFHGMGH